MKKFSIVGFVEGLSVVPTVWLTTTDEGIQSIWPSYLKNQFLINKAIIRGELPRDSAEWSIVDVRRKFGEAGITY